MISQVQFASTCARPARPSRARSPASASSPSSASTTSRTLRPSTTTPVAAVTGGVLDSEITTRERSLKGSSARLTSKAALDRWTGTPVSYEAMDYRWGTTRALLRDCVIGSADRPDPPSAEEAGDARA